MEEEPLTRGSSNATPPSQPGLRVRYILVWCAVLVAGVYVQRSTWGSRHKRPGTSGIVPPSDQAFVVNRSPSDLVSFVRELRHHKDVSSFIERASSTPIAVMPAKMCTTGVGTVVQHYRKSLAYALALGLPWVGTMENEHDNIDYTEYFGLCQPFCNHNFDSFQRVDVSVSDMDMDRCKMNGTFKIPQGLTQPTLIVIDDTVPGHHGEIAGDEGHTNCLTGMRDRFMSSAMRSVVCTKNSFLTFHFRWGDVAANDCDNPDVRGVNMSAAVVEINHIRQLCPLQVKVMSEGAEVKDCFSNRFSGDFEYVDGMQSNTPYDLLTFACTSVLIGGFSSFSVLGALLMDGLVMAPMPAMMKYESLRNVVALPPAHADDLSKGLRELAPCS